MAGAASSTRAEVYMQDHEQTGMYTTLHPSKV